jgi:hypothetical protein
LTVVGCSLLVSKPSTNDEQRSTYKTKNLAKQRDIF